MADNEIKKSALSFPVYFEKIADYTNEDDRFTKVKIYLMHTGLNYNDSIFDKKVIDEALPTLGYIPIVGFITEDAFGEKDFKGHEYIITRDENGVRRKYIGSGYGVVLSNEDNNAHYEERLCEEDNEIRTFLVVEGILWNFLEDSAGIMNRDMVKKHSMELHEPSIEGYEDDDGYFHFTKFSFRAACILGNSDNIQPAMASSTIEVQFTMSDFMKNLQSELEIKYADFTKALKNEKGGNIMANPDFTQTVLQQFEDISTTVRNAEMTRDRWGDDVPRYYAVDVQDNEVIVVDRKNNYNYYGLSFTMNGDKAEIDFTSGTRKKLRYENYEEGTSAPEGGFDFGKHISEIENSAFEKISAAESKVTDAEAKVTDAESKVASAEGNYTKIKKDYEDIKSKYDEYVKAEKEQKEQEIEAEKDAMFEKFEKELGNESDFTALKENKINLSVEEIEQKCALMFTRKRMAQDNDISDKTNFTAHNAAKVGVMNNEPDVDDGFVHTKYGDIPVRK